MTTGNLQNVRRDFPILERMVKGHPLVYLDNAATTLKPQRVADAVARHYAMEASNVHRGVHELSEQATIKYENVRKKVADFLGTKDSKEIIFTAGTTGGINLVAQSWGRTFLKPGDEIILSAMEHHSNIVPWQMLREALGVVIKVIPMNERGELNIEEYKRLLSPRTKVVAVTYISNALGTVNPVAEIIAMAKEQGAITVIDGAQAVAHLPVDVKSLDCDFFAFSGHKLYGPTGIGALYGKRALLEVMPPVTGGGAMIREVTFERTTYAEVPEKFEAGTPHIGGVIGMGEAIDYVQSLGWESIIAHEASLLSYGHAQLGKIPALRFIGTADHKSAILSFVLKGVHPHDVGTLLDERGVAIRSGHHCCQPVMRHFQVPATSRASLAIYNTQDDIDILCDAIHRTLEVFA